MGHARPPRSFAKPASHNEFMIQEQTMNVLSLAYLTTLVVLGESKYRVHKSRKDEQ